MAKHIIHIIGTFLIFAAIINGINGQCTVRDFCCHGGTDSNWTKPAAASDDGFGDCYIQGPNVVASDCPPGFQFAPAPSNNAYPAKCVNWQPFDPKRWSSVKSCATSNNCSSVNAVCGLPSNVTLRTGLTLSFSCIIQGNVNIPSCPSGWLRRSETRCDKDISTGASYKTFPKDEEEAETSASPATPPPDYSVVCENPQTYNGSHYLTQYGFTCDTGLGALSNTGNCFANIDWKTVSYSDFASLTGTNDIGPCNLLAINITQLGCCSGTPPAASEDTLDTGAATMTARGHYVFVLLTILGVMCWF